MGNDSWSSLIASPGFWGGVIASVLAAAIVGVIAFIFRNSISIMRRSRERGRKEDELFETALKLSSPYAPFAFGVVQGRALRYFLTAVFLAYIGDILSPIYPFNSMMYVVALYYIYLGLKWFFKIERRAIEIIDGAEDR